MSKAGILVVDDERLIVSTLESGLRGANYTVFVATNANEALNIAREHNKEIDLAILDIRMPGMSGIELSSLLIEQYRIHSLFLSAYANQALVDDAIGRGALGYLIKPVEISQLVPSIEAALARIRDFSAMDQSRQQLQHAVSTSRKISVCIGILMERERISEEEAFNRLRRLARSSQRPLAELAQDIVSALDSLNQSGKRP